MAKFDKEKKQIIEQEQAKQEKLLDEKEKTKQTEKVIRQMEVQKEQDKEIAAK